MKLAPLTENMCETARKWRNEDISFLRTPFFLTEKMQKDFYIDIVCNRDSKHRYYAVMKGMEFVALVGLTNISLENRSAELSLLVDPQLRKNNIGFDALLLLLSEGFKNLNLDNIYGECYDCNPAVKFWIKAIQRLECEKVRLPRRKFYDGKYYDSLYFNFNKEIMLWK
jgi:RimJ/RimL family protein N-acetyltransferase